MRSLLDVNVLVALALPRHASHEAAHAWFAREPNRLWATCPLTQAGFVRVAGRELGNTRTAIRMAMDSIELDCRSPHHEYWPADIDLLDLNESQRACLIGIKQVTDMQLVMLAHRKKGHLVTFDSGIGELAKGAGYAKSVVVL